MLRRALSGLVIALSLAVPACSGPSVDVTKVIQITDVSTGWYDAGIVEGNKNKLVPTITLRLKNTGPDLKGSVQINAVFRRIGEDEEWGSALIRAIDPNGLPAGASTNPIPLRSNLGYTGTEPRAQLLQNKLFVDARVKVFAKHGSTQWASLGEYKIDRQLLPE
jgi:hypothetical protein